VALTGRLPICLVYAIPSLASGRFVWMREAANARLNSIFGSSRSPEDMAEKFIFRKFARFNSAAVA